MTRLSLLFFAALCALPSAGSAAVDPTVEARLGTQFAVITAWAADPVIVAAVRAHNAGLAPAEDELTQESWHSLSSLDPLVAGYTRNPAGVFLRAKQSALVGEAFLSDAAGCKVAFMNKPMRWCHAGRPKHEVPMTGKPWQGRSEIDESSGLRLIQIAVPVLDGAKPIGSLVVGLSAAALSE